MREEIEKVLNDETLTTTDEKISAITKGLAPLVIPKDKYNDLNSKLKTVESNYSNLENEFNEFKKSKMTDDEKRAEELKQFEIDKKNNAIAKSELAVKNLLFDNGIRIDKDDVELNETLQNIISEDYDKTIKLATNFITLINKTKENTQKETVTDLLNNTPKPTVSTPDSSSLSKIEIYKQELDKAIKEHDILSQVKYTRLIQEENIKQKNIK